MAFLRMQLHNPYKENCNRLKQVMKYLGGGGIPSIYITHFYMTVERWFMDTSYSVHNYCKGHSGENVKINTG